MKTMYMVSECFANHPPKRRLGNSLHLYSSRERAEEAARKRCEDLLKQAFEDFEYEGAVEILAIPGGGMVYKVDIYVDIVFVDVRKVTLRERRA